MAWWYWDGEAKWDGRMARKNTADAVDGAGARLVAPDQLGKVRVSAMATAQALKSYMGCAVHFRSGRG